MHYNELKTLVCFVDGTVKTYKKRSRLREINDKNYYFIERIEDKIYQIHSHERIESIKTELIIK